MFSTIAPVQAEAGIRAQLGKWKEISLTALCTVMKPECLDMVKKQKTQKPYNKFEHISLRRIPIKHQ